MKKPKHVIFKAFFLSFLSLAVISCDPEDGVDGRDGIDGVDGRDGVDGEDGQDFIPSTSIFEDKSNLEPLVALRPQFTFVKAYSLLSSSDVLDNGFRLVGAQDGAGFVEDPNSDGFIYISNAEDDYAVARIFLDKDLNPVSADWLLNSGVADFARQCSGTMWEAAIHGGSQDLFLSASESFNYDVKGIDPYVATPNAYSRFWVGCPRGI